MKIKQFDVPTLKALRVEIDQALKAVGEKFDITLRAGNGSYTPETAHFKLEMGIKGENGQTVTKEATDFKRYAPMYGMKAEDLGKEIKVGIDTYVITGLSTKSRKFPINATNKANGKGYKLPMSAVKKALGYEVTAMDMM